MVRATIQMWGDTLAVRIPKELADELSLSPGTTVELSGVSGKLVVRAMKKRKRYALSDLLRQCRGKNPCRELISVRVGKELL